MTNISSLKQELRQTLSHKRSTLSPEQRADYSASIMRHLSIQLGHYLSAEAPLQLLVYRALPFEVATQALFENQEYHLFVPRMLPGMGMEWVAVDEQTTWVKKDFGVYEPEAGELWQASDCKTILITPLLGFDKDGNRLGMGKGFFDRWLEKHSDHLAAQIGLAFSCQELHKVPIEPHDAALSAIITEHGVITCPTN